MTIREFYEWAVMHSCEERELFIELYECSEYSDHEVRPEDLEIDTSDGVDCVRICVD